MNNKSIIIKTENITKTYVMGAEKVHALRGISLEILRGSYVSIMGPSGSGKSTFFNMVGGLDLPTTGDVYMEGQRIRDLNSRQMAWVRCHKIGFIFQSFNLISSMTALENVTIARIFSGRLPTDARRDAAAALEMVGLEHRLHHLPSELSGGQQQRVAIARAIVNQPDVILADEPTGNLDLRTGEEIIQLLGRMKSEMNITIITATHDMKMLSASDVVVWINDGAISRVAQRDELKIEIGTIDGKDV
ncbi:MAG: ABC transporter ATP-binding protein [Kiritimatiellia bacterium]|jgi:putative ABC transport system ATP-binding protein